MIQPSVSISRSEGEEGPDRDLTHDATTPNSSLATGG